MFFNQESKFFLRNREDFILRVVKIDNQVRDLFLMVTLNRKRTCSGRSLALGRHPRCAMQGKSMGPRNATSVRFYKAVVN